MGLCASVESFAADWDAAQLEHAAQQAKARQGNGNGKHIHQQVEAAAPSSTCIRSESGIKQSNGDEHTYNSHHPKSPKNNNNNKGSSSKQQQSEKYLKSSASHTSRDQQPDKQAAPPMGLIQSRERPKQVQPIDLTETQSLEHDDGIVDECATHSGVRAARGGPTPSMATTTKTISTGSGDCDHAGARSAVLSSRTLMAASPMEPTSPGLLIGSGQWLDGSLPLSAGDMRHGRMGSYGSSCSRGQGTRGNLGGRLMVHGNDLLLRGSAPTDTASISSSPGRRALARALGMSMQGGDPIRSARTRAWSQDNDLDDQWPMSPRSANPKSLSPRAYPNSHPHLHSHHLLSQTSSPQPPPPSSSSAQALTVTITGAPREAKDNPTDQDARSSTSAAPAISPAAASTATTATSSASNNNNHPVVISPSNSRHSRVDSALLRRINSQERPLPAYEPPSHVAAATSSIESGNVEQENAGLGTIGEEDTRTSASRTTNSQAHIAASTGGEGDADVSSKHHSSSSAHTNSSSDSSTAPSTHSSPPIRPPHLVPSFDTSFQIPPTLSVEYAHVHDEPDSDALQQIQGLLGVRPHQQPQLTIHPKTNAHAQCYYAPLALPPSVLRAHSETIRGHRETNHVAAGDAHALPNFNRRLPSLNPPASRSVGPQPAPDELPPDIVLPPGMLAESSPETRPQTYSLMMRTPPFPSTQPTQPHHEAATHQGGGGGSGQQASNRFLRIDVSMGREAARRTGPARPHRVVHAHEELPLFVRGPSGNTLSLAPNAASSIPPTSGAISDFSLSLPGHSFFTAPNQSTFVAPSSSSSSSFVAPIPLPPHAQPPASSSSISSALLVAARSNVTPPRSDALPPLPSMPLPSTLTPLTNGFGFQPVVADIVDASATGVVLSAALSPPPLSLEEASTATLPPPGPAPVPILPTTSSHVAPCEDFQSDNFHDPRSTMNSFHVPTALKTMHVSLTCGEMTHVGTRTGLNGSPHVNPLSPALSSCFDGPVCSPSEPLSPMNALDPMTSSSVSRDVSSLNQIQPHQPLCGVDSSAAMEKLGLGMMMGMGTAASPVMEEEDESVMQSANNRLS